MVHDITNPKKAEQPLSNSDELVRLILDSAAEAIFGCDPEGTCLFSNRAAARLLGYDDPAELLGKNMHALEHHTRADGTPYPIEECPIYIGFQKGQGVHGDDEVYWRKDGTSFPVEFWSHPIYRDGKTLGAVITFIDITERKLVEEALRKSEERWRMLLEINNAIITYLTPGALLHAVTENLRRVVPFERAGLSLYVAESETFRLLAMESELQSNSYRVGYESKRDEGLNTWVFDHQQPVLRRDLEKEQQYPNDRRDLADGIYSHSVVPLIIRGKSIGTLYVGSRTRNQYSEHDLEFLQEVGVSSSRWAVASLCT